MPAHHVDCRPLIDAPSVRPGSTTDNCWRRRLSMARGPEGPSRRARLTITWNCGPMAVAWIVAHADYGVRLPIAGPLV